jgi:hypothetical protein
MEPRAIAALEALRVRLEEDLGLSEPMRELVHFSEALEPREATRARLRAIAQRTKEAEGGKKVEPREASRERFRAIAKRTGADKPKRKLKPGEKMVFGRVVKSEDRQDEAKAVSQKKIEKLAAMLRDASDAQRPHLFAEIRARFGEKVAAQISKLVKKPMGRPSRPWMEASGPEQVACAASGALNLKRGQKGDKKKLAKEILKRTKSKKLARKAMKLAQEY